MATIASLQRTVQSLRKTFDKDAQPKTWCLCLGVSEPLPLHVQQNVKPHDRLYVRRYPDDLLGGERQGDWAYGYVYWGSVRANNALIIWPDRLGRRNSNNGR